MSTISQPVGANGVSTPPPTSTTQPKNELGEDAFLKLLVAQLKYQDPLSPADPGDFMAQTAQFTMVEKLTELADQGAATNQALGLSAATGLVGRTVSWIGEDNETVSGLVKGAISSIDGVELEIGDHKIPLDAVTAIR